jgi:WD40 repeat protein
MRGSFALSFSRSGKYLAVATQYGIISIFDAECLTETHSLMVSFTTSRPGRQAGAVRAMEFSPGPFDLLVSEISLSAILQSKSYIICLMFII